MKEQDRPPLEKEARRLYLRASRELPPDLQRRLDQARRQALRSAGPRSAGTALRRRLWWPAGALAMTCAMLLLWQPGPKNGPAHTAPEAATALAQGHHGEDGGELPPDAGQDDAGMYQDLAFYNWLATGQPDRTLR